MNNQTFEIGLVGAGAISAGAYTGGVIDFMIYALDKWYQAKENNEQTPPHEVKLSVFSGASAGAMTAALGTAFLGSVQPPIENEKVASQQSGKNKLFDCWVEKIDISCLLKDKDLTDEKSRVISLLDSSILAEIADSGLNVMPRATRRPWVAENFELLMTVTNLRGVPYGFQVNSEQPTLYDMSLHADYVHFRINENGQNGQPDRYTISWAEFGSPGSLIKEKIKMSALASGAFPVGLAPRTLQHLIAGGNHADCYNSRLWPVPTPESLTPHQCVTSESIPVNWGAIGPQYPFDFQCVDGGVMNNEPLELARKILTGSKSRNARQSNLADKAVLLIDPFPLNSSFDNKYKVAPDLMTVAIRLFGALKNQARFKVDELMLAASNDVFSRFMIAPSRDGASFPLACGGLEGFSGFLKRDFRAHDFFLGRRNAQKFLRQHFVLTEDNPLFSEWSSEMKQRWCVKDNNGQTMFRNGQRFLPIIPLVNDANTECQQASWPAYSANELAILSTQVAGRVDIVVDRLVDQYFENSNFAFKFLAHAIAGKKKKDIVRFIEQSVAKELRKMQIMK